ncbi:hypothetical protein HOC32_05490 [Candidatus Woesearchaeota archaeon]|nr:hypothetical protein [Candidatus Woesearchaeota archaeon]
MNRQCVRGWIIIAFLAFIVSAFFNWFVESKIFFIILYFLGTITTTIYFKDRIGLDKPTDYFMVWLILAATLWLTIILVVSPRAFFVGVLVFIFAMIAFWASKSS